MAKRRRPREPRPVAAVTPETGAELEREQLLQELEEAKQQLALMKKFAAFVAQRKK